MNYRAIWQILGRVLLIEAALLLLPLITGIWYRENLWPFVITMAAAAAAGGILISIKPKTDEIFAREGFAAVGLSWIAMSLFGALPFVISGDIPNYIDALFETVSGFTTTGSSILKNVEIMSRSCMFWRCFTHWVGGMGVLVFIMAVLPMSGDHLMHVMRAEVPGPTVGKLVPRAKKTAVILYLIYVVMTLIETVMLLCGGMSFYDALLHSFATAGTGGFSTRAASIGYYNSAYIDIVIGTFMILFGVNFNLYFLILVGNFKAALKSEELRAYLGIIFFAVITIAINILGLFGNFFTALRYSYFQVASIISTTGFATTNFDKWPEYSRWMLVVLMLVGACAGSTGGGVKVSRFIILTKSALCDIKKLVRPRSVYKVRLEGKSLDEQTVQYSQIFFYIYLVIIFISVLLVSLDGFDLTTNLTATVACISNIGPGLSLVGPNGNFGMFSWFSKLVLIFDMLIGRLEIYPILLLCSPSFWRRNG
jgi:trk system potassium uptake protein TrkH